MSIKSYGRKSKIGRKRWVFFLEILMGHPTVLGAFTRFWCPLVPSNASRKFSRRRDIMEWVLEMFSRSRTTRRIKNQSHTMSQSNVMGAKVKSVGTCSKTVGVSLGNSDGASYCFWSNYAFLVTIDTFKCI